MRSISLLLTLLYVVTPLAMAQGSAAMEPIERIRWSNSEILSKFGDDDVLSEQEEEEVYAVMDEVTDFRTMADTAIAGLCEDVPESKCEEFKDTFTELLRISSIKRLGRYRADEFDYVGQDVDEDLAVVETIARFEGEDYTLDYEMALRDGEWAIVNYIFDDVDTVRNYRRRFTRLLEQEGVDEVIARLESSIEGYRSESG